LGWGSPRNQSHGAGDDSSREKGREGAGRTQRLRRGLPDARW
jgi:hypothetical protein